jgi:hypothetical protein
MRELSSGELDNAAYLTSFDVPYALIEITGTQLTKSILDATDLFREFVAAYGIHDYAAQAWGIDKRMISTSLIDYQGRRLESKTSLYRANGRGDPRLWITSLASLAADDDVIGVIWSRAQFWVVNLSAGKLADRILAEPALADVLGDFVSEKTSNVRELLALMRAISAKGFIRAPVDGSTAIGRLLESELGIEMNSRAQPDFKGIEIKSSRATKNRTTLFAKTPAWTESNFHSSRELLDAFGYKRGDRRKLYCQIDGHKSNSQGLRLVVHEAKDSLTVAHEPSADKNVAVWELETLRYKLSDKHDETFWVEAKSKKIDGWEYLRFETVQHTRKPIIAQLSPSLSNGTISLDFTISDKGTKVHDKGYLFKLLPKNRDQLFPPADSYDLSAAD